MPNPKIATCCYCGTRAALVLKGEASHELACASCGAPLHDLKQMRTDKGARSASKKRRKQVDLPPTGLDGLAKVLLKPKKLKKLKKKGFLHGAIDLLDDIFD